MSGPSCPDGDPGPSNPGRADAEAIRASGVDMDRLDADLDALMPTRLPALLRRNLAQAESLWSARHAGLPHRAIPATFSALNYDSFKKAVADGARSPPSRNDLASSHRRTNYVHGSQMSHKMRATWRHIVLSTLLPVALAFRLYDDIVAATGNIRRARDSPNVIQRYVRLRRTRRSRCDAVDTTEMDLENLRQVVGYPRRRKRPGTIIVDPHRRFLYSHDMGNGQALRYGVGVGKAGLEPSGTATVH